MSINFKKFTLQLKKIMIYYKCQTKTNNDINVIAIDRFGHRLSTRALQNNGAFCKMLESGESNSRALTATVKEIVGCDRHAAFWYKVMYEKWKNIFYPDGKVGD